ncbi:DUF5681 domain-containing protein [Bradyrhizobium sp. AZCC 2289]|uniref:DUF5681 domain-containing protein n=1 Tax=Bradyrhizobium sp. AZCC 2289 TaxID=3117026 RepID=UPI002FF00BED
MKTQNNVQSATSYGVGYRRPPKASQFRKGRSGNPRGRRPSEENMLSIFKRIATKRVKVNDGSKIRTISLAEAVILQNYKAALQKDQIAMGNILRLADHAGEFKDWNDPKVGGMPIFMPTRSSSTEEFLAENDAGRVQISSSRTYNSRED